MKFIKLIVLLLFSVSAFSQTEIPKSILDSLKTELEIVFKKDQTFRRIYKEAETKLGKDSFEYEYFWQVTEAQDKVLEAQVTDIIDKYGWLGISQVGKRANTAIWGVMQHGSVANKQKYAPLLKASVLKKESQPGHYARLIDRMLINSDRPQLYGTQYKYDDGKAIFFPIKNTENINKRRQAIGLGTIEAFAKTRQVEWPIKSKK